VSYRPITDVWFLARARLKGGATYYGAYLGGFPERARALLGATIGEPVLHVCGGCARLYPYAGGFGNHDKTLDLNRALKPDYLQDAREAYPHGFKAMLADPPYSADEAEHYTPGRSAYPAPNVIVRNAIAALKVGHRVGIIHYLLPKAPANARFVAAVGVMCGFNNRIRCYSVFEKTA
jgi:hypothetical protein